MADPDPPGPAPGSLCREIVILSEGPALGRGYRRKVISLLLDPTKEGRSKRGPAPRDGIDLLELYTIYSHNN